MKVILALAIIVLVSGPAYAQDKPVPRYGETTTEKTPSEIENERKAAADYKRSLGNIPSAGPTDPWGSVRGDSGTKPAAKTAPVKSAKPATPAN